MLTNSRASRWGIVMPSNSYDEYHKNLRDVHRLVLLHDNLKGTGRGRRGLGHLTRGGILLLCAAWERYCEALVEEAAKYLSQHVPAITAMPAPTGQKVRDHANSGKTTWTAAQVAGSSWSNVYLDYVKIQTASLNTPKSQKLTMLFKNCLGIPDVASFWTSPTADVDAFVTLRGEVAHRGTSSKYVRIGQLQDLEALTTRLGVDTDNKVAQYLKTAAGTNRLPWNRTR